MNEPQLYTVAYEIRDREAFRSLLARHGIDTHVTPDGEGGTTITLDRMGMEMLHAWFANHGDIAQAEAIQEALDR